MQSSAVSSALHDQTLFPWPRQHDAPLPDPPDELYLGSKLAHCLQQLHRCWHVQLIPTVPALVEALQIGREVHPLFNQQRCMAERESPTSTPTVAPEQLKKYNPTD